MTEITQSFTLFYIREGLWRKLQVLCQNEYKRLGDPFFLFWKSYGAYKEGSPVEAINELNTILQKRELQYATVVALIFYNQQCKTIDNEALMRLKQMEDDLKRSGGDKALIQAAYFFMFNEELRKAKDCLNQITSKTIFSEIARAWLQICEREDSSIKSALSLLETVIKEESGQNPRVLEALMGKVKASEIQKKFTVTLDTLNEILVMFPKFEPALIEKSRILLLINDYDQSQEIAYKLYQKDPQNVLALRLVAFHLIAREGNQDEGVDKLQKLIEAIDSQEPKNAKLCYEVAQLFSRVCGRSVQIIQLTMKLIDRAKKIQPLEADYVIELGQIYYILEDYENAYKTFQDAAQLDESKIEALCGMIKCRIMQGMLDEAQTQIDFVNEIAVSIGRTSEMAYLEAILGARKDVPASELESKVNSAIKFLDEALKLHINQSKSAMSGFPFYIAFNPDFLLSLSQEYLSSGGISQQNNNETIPMYVTKGNKLLELITKQTPGVVAAYLLLAKGKMIARDTSGALKAIQKCLEMNPTNEEAAILFAQISFSSGNIGQAKYSLDQAISTNFKIRDNPLFMLVKGQVELAQENWEEALNTLEIAYNLPGVSKLQVSTKKKKNAGGNTNKSSKILGFTEKDRCQIFLCYAKALMKLKRHGEAKSIMTQAIQNFSGTAEEVNVLIANSEMTLESGDTKKAISILKGVQKDSPYYADSRILLSNIYLKYLCDRRSYAKCFTDLIEDNPNYDNYVRLGEAMMKIQEPESALKAFEQAYELNPSDENVTREIGKALILTHDYPRAIAYYKDSLEKNSKRLDLRLDFAKLLIKLGKLDDGARLLDPELYADDFTVPTLASLRRSSEAFLWIAKLNLKRDGSEQKPNPAAKDAYAKAIKYQKEAIEKCKSEGGNLDAEKIQFGELLYEVAKYFAYNERTENKSIQLLDEALKYLIDNQQILGMQADLYMKMADRDNCQNKCIQILKLNPNHDYASYLISEILLQNDEPEKAYAQFKRILEEKPDNFNILSKMIDFLRRLGNLEESKKYIAKAQKITANPSDPGLAFCKGLYNQYTRNPAEALVEYNKAKRSATFRTQAVSKMIEIYLSPDQDLLYTTVEENASTIQPDNFKAAENLIKEVQGKIDPQKYIVLEAYVQMFSNNKNNIEQANKQLTELLKNNSDYIPAMYALSIAKFIAKKQTDAKNLLKVLSKKNYTSEYAEDLEKSWLLFADTYISIQKFDMAEELLRKCLKYNQTCGKADEYMGLIKEKEQSYVDAADHYEKAWKIYNEKNPAIGFRLAFNYLKAKKYVDCIRICKRVLELFPGYPKIDKDILGKAQASLRGLS